MILAALTAGLAAASATGSALAGGPHATRAPSMLAQAGGSVSADEAAQRVRAASGGRILEVRLESGSGGAVYRVKVLLDGGRVRIYRVDAASGRILE